MTALIDEARNAGITLLLDGDRVKVRGKPAVIRRLAPRLKAHREEVIEALKAERRATRPAIAEHDGGLSREAAEELAVQTVWRWTLDSGDKGIYRSMALTHDEARHELEQKFQRKVTHLEFISAIAEGFGFVPYHPSHGAIRQ